MKLALKSYEQLPPGIREELEQLVAAIRSIEFDDMNGYPDDKTVFLRGDGEFTKVTTSHVPVLVRISFRG